MSPKVLGDKLVTRHISVMVDEALEEDRVVVVNGARQAGKTTLARQLIDRRGGTFLSLDQAELGQAARDDPAFFLSEARREPVVIDEFQRAPELLLAIKEQVDRDPRPGRYVLTGSTRFLTVPTLSESLTGRAAILDLWPLSQGELEGTSDRFVD